MRIEHFALQVEDPVAMAQWYAAQLGFQVKKKLDGAPRAHFIVDATGNSMLEIYHNPKFPVPSYRDMAPATLHIAFVCDDVPGAIKRLVAAGATLLDTGMVGDDGAMLRDPWGLAIQLCKRGKPMLS